MRTRIEAWKPSSSRARRTGRSADERLAALLELGIRVPVQRFIGGFELFQQSRFFEPHEIGRVNCNVGAGLTGEFIDGVVNGRRHAFIDVFG